MTERYTETALHFDAEKLPKLLARHLPPGPLALADLGCGDGPLFAALARDGFIGRERPVFAVDLEADRLARVSARFPWIETIVASAESVPASRTARWTSSARRWSWSTSRRAGLSGRDPPRPAARRTGVRHDGLQEGVGLVLPEARGESVLDTSHLREYTDLPAFRALVAESGCRIVALERTLLWFPLLDPILFRLGHRLPGLRRRRGLLGALRAVKVPIPGYYALEVVLER